MSKLCVAGEKIVTICEKGDKLIEEEIGKVYRGKKITKGTERASLFPCRRLPPPNRSTHHSLHSASRGSPG